MNQLVQLNNSMDFPHPSRALQDPDGLLAIGGDLEPERLKAAYRAGIFPFYNDDPPKSLILWWSPSKRAVLFPKAIHISRSLKRALKKQDFKVTFDQSFVEVIEGCADRNQTWITKNMQNAYIRLHHEGVAHSVEIWQDNQLAGGLYGVSMGLIFFAESMFSLQTNASKAAMVYLAKHLGKQGFPLIDCQLQSPHLERMGVVEISRATFLQYLEQYATGAEFDGPWQINRMP